MPTPQEVSELVKRFDRNRESYRSNEYNETEKTKREKTIIKRQIDATERQTDQLVYELYGLTDEETKTIEGIATLSDVQISKGGA